MAKFVQFFHVDYESLEARCTLCVESTVIKFSKSSKTNLKTHVETAHKHATFEQKAAAIGSSTMTLTLKGPPEYCQQEAVTNAIVALIIDQFWWKSQAFEKF